MTLPAGRRRRGRILFSLLLLLLAIGVIPLLYTSYSMFSSSKERLETNQQEMQLDKARGLASQVKLYVESLRGQVAAIATTLAIDAERRPFSEVIARIAEEKALTRYPENDPRLVYVAVLDVDGNGAYGGLDLPDPAIHDMLSRSFSCRRRSRSPSSSSARRSSPQTASWAWFSRWRACSRCGR
jgi:hypothetical protein